MSTRNPSTKWLLIGDILAAWVVTMIGFITHYGTVDGWRWLSTFLPVVAAWLLIAPWFEVYREEISGNPRLAWRAGYAALLSAPLAAALRGLWLNAAILPVFVVVMALTNALGFLIWRMAWAFWARRRGLNG